MKKFKNLLVICFAFFALAMLAGCVTVCQHETGSWAANKEEHWKTCSLCGEQVQKAAHNFGEFEEITAPAVGVDGLKVRKCADCAYVEQQSIPALVVETGTAEGDFAVYAKVPADWTAVNCYFFDIDKNALPLSGGWPGYEMTLVNAEENIWGFIVPAGTGHVIFNFGGSVQTADLPFATELNYYVLREAPESDGKYLADYQMYTPAEDQPELNKYPDQIKEEEKYSVYVQLPEAWAAPNAYWWGGVGSDAWPGIPMVQVEGNVWTFDLSTAATGLIFNCDGQQTADILVASGLHAGNAYIVADDLTFEAANYKDGVFSGIVTTVYAELPEAWAAPNAYWWGGTGSGDWPGVAMTHVDGKVWSIDLPAEAEGLIFNCDGQQTANIDSTNGLHAGNAYIVADDKSFKPANYKDGVFEEVSLEVEIPTDCYIKGGMNGWTAVAEYQFQYDEATDTATFTVAIEENVEFKVTVGPEWTIEFNSGNAQYSDAAFADAGGNIKCIAAGTYVFTITDVTKDTRALTIAAAE